MDSLPPLQSRTLYLVATPIGNLEDITLRALRVLRECDTVAAEDTRRAGILLRHFDIQQRLVSCHKFNEARRLEGLLTCLENDGTVALISDAGMPGISDPGTRLVRSAIDRGLRVETVPGPCALVAALAASGLATEEFHFTGFPPRKPGARRRHLESLAEMPGTLVMYESPHRVGRLLGEMAVLWPECPVVLARELTKKFEEYLRGTAAGLFAQLGGRKMKGEFVVLVGEPRSN